MLASDPHTTLRCSLPARDSADFSSLLIAASTASRRSTSSAERRVEEERRNLRAGDSRLLVFIHAFSCAERRVSRWSLPDPRRPCEGREGGSERASRAISSDCRAKASVGYSGSGGRDLGRVYLAGRRPGRSSAQRGALLDIVAAITSSSASQRCAGRRLVAANPRGRGRGGDTRRSSRSRHKLAKALRKMYARRLERRTDHLFDSAAVSSSGAKTLPRSDHRVAGPRRGTLSEVHLLAKAVADAS